MPSFFSLNLYLSQNVFLISHVTNAHFNGSIADSCMSFNAASFATAEQPFATMASFAIMASFACRRPCSRGSSDAAGIAAFTGVAAVEGGFGAWQMAV